MDHKGGQFKRVVVRTCAKPIHDQQRSRLQSRCEDLRVSLCALLELDDITRKCILFNLKDHGGPLGVFAHAQIIAILGLSHDHHMRHAQLAGSSDEVF